MITSIFRIISNANVVIYKDITGKKYWFKIILFYSFLLTTSILVVYYNPNHFIEDQKVVANLLSLFSGLMFSVLLKIPDKLKDLKPLPDGITLPEQERIDKENAERLLVYNYLQGFMYTISYSIVIAIVCISLVIVNSFFPSLNNSNISFEVLNHDLTFKAAVILFYRFLLAFFLFKFIIFVFYSVSYLYNFSIYEFKQIRKEE